MAKSKRAPAGTSAENEVDMNNESGLSNEARSKLPMDVSGTEKRLQKRRKAM